MKPCKEWRASDDCTSFSNSTKAMSLRPGTSLTSLNPGNLLGEGRREWMPFHVEGGFSTHWLKSIVSIISFVSVGKFVRNKILLGASFPVGWPPDPKINLSFKKASFLLLEHTMRMRSPAMCSRTTFLSRCFICLFLWLLLQPGLEGAIFLGNRIRLALGIGNALEEECVCIV